MSTCASCLNPATHTIKHGEVYVDQCDSHALSFAASVSGTIMPLGSKAPEPKKGPEPKNLNKTGWYCPPCEEIHTGNLPKSITAWETGGEEIWINKTNDYAYTEVTAHEVFQCPEDEDHYFTPDDSDYETGQVWECGECEIQYIGEEAARNCCL